MTENAENKGIEKFFGIYFDKYELRIDSNGDLQNPEALRIIEFDFDEENGGIVAFRRVTPDGKVLEENPDLADFISAGFDDDDTITKAMRWFDQWLEDNREWRISSPQTYWQPAEYICVGISGCVDDPPRYHRRSRSWH